MDITHSSAQDRLKWDFPCWKVDGSSTMTVLENLELGAYLRRDKSEIRKGFVHGL